MRLSFGNKKRKYLYDIRFWTQSGQEKRVQAVYRGDEMIFPTMSDLAERVTLDLSGMTDTEEGAYWHHAIGALKGDYPLTAAAVIWKQEFFAHVCIAGKWFDLIHKDEACPAFPLADYERGTLLLGDSGSPVVGVQVGDEVIVRVRIPQHESERLPGDLNASLDGYIHTRWLPGAYLTYYHWKNKKRHHPHRQGSVMGEPSQTRYFDLPDHKHVGHGRGYIEDMDYAVPSLVPQYGDTVFHVQIDAWNGSGITDCRMVFPAFEREFRLKVVDVVRHG